MVAANYALVMRLTIGIVLTLVGGIVAVIGLLGALGELMSLYSSALNDPLAADAPEGKAVGASMIRWVIIGATGVPLLLVGAVILKISLFQKLRKMHAARSAPARQVQVASHWETPPAAVRNKPAKPAAAPNVGTAARREERPSTKPMSDRRDELGESGGSKSER